MGIRLWFRNISSSILAFFLLLATPFPLDLTIQYGIYIKGRKSNMKKDTLYVCVYIRFSHYCFASSRNT